MQAPPLPRFLIPRLPFFYGWVVLGCICLAGFARQGPAVAPQQQRVGRQARRGVQVVQRDDQAALRQRSEHAHDHRLVAGILVCGRLIQQDERCVLRQRSRDGNTLTLAP